MSSEFTELSKACAYLPKKDLDAIHQAYLFADKAHQTQKRLSGEHYIIHPLAVAKIVAEMRLDKESIIAALLHDVVEDTHFTLNDVKKKFGRQVAKLVDGLSKLTQIKFDSKAHAQAENFRKLILAMVQDVRVILIKLADRLHNIQTLQYQSPRKRRRIAQETLEIYVPLADRLGIRFLHRELENLSFMQRYPMRAQILEASVLNMRKRRESSIRNIIAELSGALKLSKVTQFQIKKYPRSLYSIYQHMRKEHMHFEDVVDQYQFAVIVQNVAECYQALGVVHQVYKPLPGYFKDYIAMPKLNGYQSLHTVLVSFKGRPIRLQIRTERMQKMAEYGLAYGWLSHLEDPETSATQKRINSWMKNLLEIQNHTANSVEFIEHVKNDLFPDEVYVFTPKGTLLELPGNATALDFAYAIHTDLGNQAIAAKIDHRLSPLNTVLGNGQKIEIVTSPHASPNPDWLNFVVTGRARSTIRHYLKHLRKSKAAVLGKRLLERSLNELGVTLRKIPKAQIKLAREALNIHSLKQLFIEIGLGNQLAPIIAKRFMNQELFKLSKVLEKGKPLQIKGTEGVVVQFAKCCYPIPGDFIEGVLTKDHGIVVHHAACKNLLDHELSDKYIALSWSNHVQGTFEVNLHIDLLNQKGALARLAKAVADAESNIDNIKVLEEKVGKYAILSLIISVENCVQLAQVMTNIRQLNIVTDVRRWHN